MMEKEKETGNASVYNFIAEASKKAMTYWITTETNHNSEIIEAVKQFIENRNYLNLEKWDEITNKDAIQRMYKNISSSRISQTKRLKIPYYNRNTIQCTHTYNETNH